MQEQSPSRFLSIKAVSAWLGIPLFTIYSWSLSRRMPHYRIGGVSCFQGTS